MPSIALPPASGVTNDTSTYAVWPRNATSYGPPPPIALMGIPLAKVVTAPVSGSTREILPATGSVTNSAPPGPTVLPNALSSVASS